MMIDEQNLSFITSFREAAPYMRYLSGKTIVLSISSHVIRNELFPILARDISLLNSLGIRIVLVHGISQYLDNHHSKIQKIDKNQLEEIKKANGQIRFDIEAALSAGFINMPINVAQTSLISGNFIVAKPKGVIDGVDSLFSGVVRRIDIDAINQQLLQNRLVLVSPIGNALSGTSYALSSHEVASKIAIALQAEKLFFLTRAEGIIDQSNNIIKNLSAEEARNYINDKHQHNDILNLLPYALDVINAGINRVQITSGSLDGGLFLELFTRNGVGTSIAKKSFTLIRSAEIQDIPDLMNIIQPLIEQGVLLERSQEYLEQYITHFSVLEYDKIIYGCIALNEFIAENVGELSCLAVHPSKSNQGYGQLLTQHIIEKAKHQGLKRLFALTTQTIDWFLERGFYEVAYHELPQCRQETYLSNKRRSKVLILEL